MIELIITASCGICAFLLSFSLYDKLPKQKEAYRDAKKEYEQYFGEYYHHNYHNARKNLYNVYVSITACYCLLGFFVIMFLNFIKTI